MIHKEINPPDVLNFAVHELRVCVDNAITIPNQGISSGNFFLHDSVIGDPVVRINDDEGQRPLLFETKALDFLDLHAEWLNRHKINFDLFYTVLLANCLCFAVHTLELERDEITPSSVSQNRYTQQFDDFSDSYLEKLRNVFTASVGAG